MLYNDIKNTKITSRVITSYSLSQLFVFYEFLRGGQISAWRNLLENMSPGGKFTTKFEPDGGDKILGKVKFPVTSVRYKGTQPGNTVVSITWHCPNNTP